MPIGIFYHGTYMKPTDMAIEHDLVIKNIKTGFYSGQKCPNLEQKY
jgi:hypothetical protein